LNSGEMNTTFDHDQRSSELQEPQPITSKQDFVSNSLINLCHQREKGDFHQKLSIILDTMSDAMVMTDRNFIIQEYNTAFKRIFPSIGELSENPNLSDFIPLELLNKKVIFIKRNHLDTSHFEFCTTEKQDTIFSVTFSIGHQTSHHGESYIFLLHDISELKLIEKLKNNIINFASQEIQNPLSGLLGLIALLNEKIKEAENAIHR